MTFFSELGLNEMPHPVKIRLKTIVVRRGKIVERQGYSTVSGTAPALAPPRRR